MIGGTKKIAITPEIIFQRLSQYDIFRYYMPTKNWKLNQSTHSPFHKDETPSFIIGNKGGNITFIDFADTSKKGDCFTFIKLLYGIDSMHEVMLKIDRDFGLGLSGSSTNTGVYKLIQAEYKQPEELGKRYANIQVMPRKFTKEELAYWSEYHQDIQDLRDNNIFSVNKVFLNKQRFALKETELRFGYYYNGHWKIYVPYASKNRKWLSNVPLSRAGGLENLDPNMNTLVCKSLKDYMVCKKVYKHVCYVQNESTAAFSEETVKFIKENSKEVYYGGDSDDPGKAASYIITQEFGFKHINPPNELFREGIKDFAEMGKVKGLECLEEHFIKKGLM